jgi:adenosylcobinamide kinase / adenosylcobinamide-phosphate guanylyltransferase
MKTLVLGGVRSGKSRFAERLAREEGGAVAVIVTATAGDEEMAQRIELHRARRPADWLVVEAPVELGGAIRDAAVPGVVVIVDCLTLWLANLLALDDSAAFTRERDALLNALEQVPGFVVLVSNEVGAGIVPTNQLARRFRDEAGILHQQLAQVCEHVVLMVAGLPLAVKGATAAPAGPR